MTTDKPVSIGDAVAALPGPWQPRDLAFANGAAVRVALFDGEFPWHHHDEDELFLCKRDFLARPASTPAPTGRVPPILPHRIGPIGQS